MTFRPDVEGLRAVAVGSVLLYHAGLAWFSGGYVGVDVFFVISGYLITGLLVRELSSTGTVSLRDFYARRAKRLLPSLAVVLLSVSVLAWMLFPSLRRASTYGDVVASALYVENWWLAHHAVGYSAAGLQASPVQHIWSLAVEEQFYLVWPLLLLAATAWRRGRRRDPVPPVLKILTTVTLGSFGYCLWATAVDPDRAYFSTLTRAWELGMGGVVAVVLLRREPPTVPARPLLALLGLAAIAAAVVGFDDATSFPGASALVPTLGAVAVIVAGSGGRLSEGPQRLLASAPMRHVGRLSYTWYLWHWPLLVFAEARWGSLTPGVGLLVVAASYVPTWLTHRLVEARFHHSPGLSRHPWRALRLGLVCTASAVAAALALQAATPMVPTISAGQAVGAKALAHGGDRVQKTATGLRPAPQDAASDRGRLFADGCQVPRKHTVPPPCVYGDPGSSTTVVLFGDSHALHWFPALVRIAERRHWRLVGLVKAACPPSDANVVDPLGERAYTECAEWHRNAFARIEKLRPDLIVTSSRTAYRVIDADGRKLGEADSMARVRKGYRRVFRRLHRATRHLVVIGDVPHHRNHVADCVADHLHDLQACAIPQREAVTSTPLLHIGRSMRGVTVVDPTPKLCPGRTCPGVIGNVIVYRSAGHLTATYVRTLEGWLDQRLPGLRGNGRASG